MEKAELASAIKSIAKLQGEFTLRSGQVSDTYFDKYRFESEPSILKAIAEQLSDLVPDNTEVLCAMEMGGIPIATMLSHVTGLPVAFIRKEAKTYGTCRYAEGADLANKTLLIVEDVVSSGGAIIDRVEAMRADGYSVSKALCVIDRRAEKTGPLADAGIHLTALFTMDEIEDSS